MKVAVYLFEPSDGGLDRVAILLANYLLKRGVDVELWMARADGPVADLIDHNLKVRIIAAPPARRRFAMIAQFPGLLRAVRSYRPDILYSAGNQSNMLIALSALGARTAAVARISNPIVRPGQSGLKAMLRKAKFRAISRFSAATIVMGITDEDLLKSPGPLRARRVMLLPRPTITPMMETAARNRPPRSSGPVKFVMVGRLVEQKGQAMALRALSSLKDVDWRLTIAGTGPLLEELQDLCSTLGIASRVRFAGFVASPEELSRLLSDADMLLQPSRWEAMGATMIEALACGAGVVATSSTPNIAPVLAAAGQHLPTPINDEEAFARAIIWSLRNVRSRDQLANAIAEHRVEDACEAHLHAFHTLKKI